MRFAALLVPSFVIAAACAPSVTDACNAYATAFCSRNLACLTGSDLQSFEGVYGADQDSCVTTYVNDTCKSGQAPCPVGIDYDTNQAEQCATDYQNSSCMDVSKPGFQPDSCATDKVCHN